MKAVILAAGEGKRLRPFTKNMPKVMLPIANKPILEYIVDALSESNIRDIVMVVGYKKESIMDYFESGKEFGVNIEYIIQEKQIGTGHALMQAERCINDQFLVLPGDNVINGKSLSALINNRCKTAILIEESSSPSKYGVVKVEEEIIKGIIEKPEKTGTNLVSTGVYKFQPIIFDIIKEGMKYGKNQITDPLQSMIEKGEKICAVKGSGEWRDVIYPWNLLDVNAKALQNILPATSGKIEKSVVVKGKVVIGEGTTIHSGCYITGPVVIGKGCEIGPNVCIFPSTSIGNNVAIYPFSEIRYSVVMDGATVGSYSSVSHSVIGKGTKILSHFSNMVGKSVVEVEGEFHEIYDIGSFIGDDCEIGGNVVVEPGKIIGENCKINSLKVIDRDIPGGSKVM
ncbi:MAG: bifunctional sugar-1-phosphate nucleotidylyltransferase/acetyltransferase [Candidatus Thermoplasmatota archaeon]|nr:bifunctional sugar-1-phosphate nucleotidylyltransferase/acetyltransferase [Candidatus Thermoplasmatota archaeon]